MADDFAMLTSADAVMNVPNPYEADPVQQIDDRPQDHYGWSLFGDDSGTAYVLWSCEGDAVIDTSGGSTVVVSSTRRLRAFSPERGASRVFTVVRHGRWQRDPQGDGKLAAQWKRRDNSGELFAGELPAIVNGPEGRPVFVTVATRDSSGTITTYRCESDLWHDSELRVSKEQSFQLSVADLGSIQRDSLASSGVVPFPQMPGHYLALGHYVCVRWWDVPAMIAHQPRRYWAAVADQNRLGPARQITPDSGYGDIGDLEVVTNRQGWAVATCRPVEFDGRPLMISLWDGSSWQTVKFESSPLAPAPVGEPVRMMNYRPVLLDRRLLFFGGRYGQVVDVRCGADGKPTELVWSRGLDFGEGRWIQRAANVGDGAIVVMRNEVTNSWEYAYVTPDGFSEVKPLPQLTVRYLDHCGWFDLVSSGDGTCHLVWQCKDTKRLCYMRLSRTATSS
ncbi:MAG: hypothetical protein GXY74_10700 [Phycisphaerae bacterium]|nr:hypothetical protein [Phycisphaerae bacterium]